MRKNEGAQHEKPRFVLQPFIASVDLARLRQKTQSIAARAASQADLSSGAGLSGWIFDVPVMVVADLLGFDEAELEQVARWMADFVACLSPLNDAARLAASSVAANALMARFAELVIAASVRPDSALALIQAEAMRSGWTDARALLSNLVGLLSQTFEATAGLLGNSIIALTRQVNAADLIHQDQRLLELVNEVSRHDPSIHNTRRFVVKPLELMGVKLLAGDCILMVLAAAGRDSAGFGHGRHQCPGQKLASTIADAALGIFLEKNLRAVLPQKWKYLPSVNARIPVFLD